MLYTIRRISGQPIFVVKIRPPLHLYKDIYAVDDVFAWVTREIPGRIYRIDDFTALRELDFTLSDAILWLTGVMRDDAYWEGRINHIAVGEGHITELAQRIGDEGIDRVRVTLFPSIESASDYIHEDIRRRSRGA